MTQTAGVSTSGFSAVGEQFNMNFSHRGEVGASVCVIVDGRTVVNLWGGVADVESGKPWNKDTVGNVFSSTKGAVALCAHMLADAGELDFCAPVSRYWPEFGQHGKSDIPVRMILNHQAGVPAVRREISKEELYDPHALPHMLEKENLFWEPGTQHGYHALTFGTLIDELFRRITGQAVGVFFQQEVARPLGLVFWVGLPEAIEPRLASLVLPPPGLDLTSTSPVRVNPIADHVRSGIKVVMAEICSREFRAAGIPSGGGITNAQGLAAMYAPLSLDGSSGGTRLVREAAIPVMAYARSVSERDATLSIPTCFTLGFAKSWGAGKTVPGMGFAIGERAFGHPGMGGSIGFADPDNRLAFGYTMNRLNGLPSLDDRAQSLIDAVYLSLGLENRDPGFWRKKP